MQKKRINGEVFADERAGTETVACTPDAPRNASVMPAWLRSFFVGRRDEVADGSPPQESRDVRTAKGR